MIYLIGSLRNPLIPSITNQIAHAGFDVFSEWFGAGPIADDSFRDYHRAIGRSYMDALKTDAARTIFEFDKIHIEQASTVILIAPCGRSGHLELGWALGRGKRGYYLLDNPERWDLMLQFCDGVFSTVDDLLSALSRPISLAPTLEP